jgi:hypothetical protein
VASQRASSLISVPPGQLIGFLAFVAWVVALGLILWEPEVVEKPRPRDQWGRIRTDRCPSSLCLRDGPRLSSRPLILAPSGLRLINAACPGAAHGSEVSARIALNQLSDQFIHIEVVKPGCEQADKDIRIRSEDLPGVLPAP